MSNTVITEPEYTSPSMFWAVWTALQLEEESERETTHPRTIKLMRCARRFKKRHLHPHTGEPLQRASEEGKAA